MPMSEFEQLTALVEDRNVRIINVVGVPRSISTALGRALNEADNASIYINEPFNRNNRSLEVAASHILKAATPAEARTAAPHTIITKNMATYLGQNEFKRLISISDAVAWSVRHPLVQMGSLVTRIANDIAHETGADKIDQDGLVPYLKEVTQFLVDSELSQNFSRTGWTAMAGHFHCDIDSKPSVVVDGGLLVAQPAQILKRTSEALGLTYSESMVGGWQDNFTNVNIGSSRFGTSENAWTKEAANSSGITNGSREPLSLDVLPVQLRQHILEVALPIYEEMTQSF